MALDELLDEHEQGEKLRAWLRKNASNLISGLVISVGLIGGWTWWTQHRQQQKFAAADAYQSVLAALETGDLDTAERAANGLHDGTYGTLIALDFASAHVKQGEIDAAIASLRRAESPNPALQLIIRQRLARLLIATGAGEEALALSTAGLDTDAATLEIRGDAHFALGQLEQAQGAYRDALRTLDVAAPQRRLLEYKLVQAGGTPERRDEVVS